MTKPVTIHKQLSIEVTKADIAEGFQQDKARCPVALATKRSSAGGAKGVEVDDDIITFKVDGLVLTYDLPESGCKFIKKFDDLDEKDRASFKPIKFAAKLSRVEVA